MHAKIATDYRNFIHTIIVQFNYAFLNKNLTKSYSHAVRREKIIHIQNGKSKPNILVPQQLFIHARSKPS